MVSGVESWKKKFIPDFLFPSLSLSEEIFVTGFRLTILVYKLGPRPNICLLQTLVESIFAQVHLSYVHTVPFYVVSCCVDGKQNIFLPNETS